MRIALWILFVGLTAAAQPAKKPTIVMISGEYEYASSNSLPAFKQFLESNYALKCVYLERKGEQIPGLEAYCKKLEASGIKLDTPYTKRPELGISLAFITDPWGTTIELNENLPPAH